MRIKLKFDLIKNGKSLYFPMKTTGVYPDLITSVLNSFMQKLSQICVRGDKKFVIKQTFEEDKISRFLVLIFIQN